MQVQAFATYFAQVGWAIHALAVPPDEALFKRRRGNECRTEFFNHVLKDVGIALLADIIIHVFVIASSHNEPEAFSDLARGLAKRNTVDQALFERVRIFSP